MDHELIATIALGLVAAFIGSFVATRLRFPTIVGCLLAGVVIGPHTPGFAGNTEIATQLAEIGVSSPAHPRLPPGGHRRSPQDA